MWIPATAAYHNILRDMPKTVNNEAEAHMWKPLETIYVPHFARGNSQGQKEKGNGLQDSE